MTPHPLSPNPPCCSPAQEGPGEYGCADKLYVSIEDIKSTGSSLDRGPCGIVSVYRRATDATYEKTTYKIMGEKGPKFKEALSKVCACVLLSVCLCMSHSQAPAGGVLALCRYWCLGPLTLLGLAVLLFEKRIRQICGFNSDLDPVSTPHWPALMRRVVLSNPLR